MSTPSTGSLSKAKPIKKLTRGVKRAKGRNNQGRITSRHRGGGAKRRFREIDFSYAKRGIPARIEAIEYDPNRSGRIARLVYADGERRYMLAPASVAVGDTVQTAEDAPVRPGNRVPLSRVPVGTFVYNVELRAGGGAKLARSAGSAVEVIAHDGGFAHLKMPSSEVRRVSDKSWVTIGTVSNSEHKLTNKGKAGRNRWLGRRPVVRGSAMAAVDHPYGGGEGRAPRGHRRARTIWGKPVGKGQKTRSPKKYSNAMLVRRRKVGKKRK